MTRTITIGAAAEATQARPSARPRRRPDRAPTGRKTASAPPFLALSAHHPIAAARQAGEQMRIEAFRSVVAQVRANPATRDQIIAAEVGAARGRWRAGTARTFERELEAMTDPRFMPVFEQALDFARQVIAERKTKDHSLLQAVTGVARQVLRERAASPAHALAKLKARYAAKGDYSTRRR